MRAPTTLGTHLRAYTFGHVRRLDAVASRLLAGHTRRVPGLVSGAETVAYLDVDDTIRETHGYAKQGTGYGCSGVRGLNAQLATLFTPTVAPVIAATRLRRGPVAHGAKWERVRLRCWRCSGLSAEQIPPCRFCAQGVQDPG